MEGKPETVNEVETLHKGSSSPVNGRMRLQRHSLVKGLANEFLVKARESSLPPRPSDSATRGSLSAARTITPYDVRSQGQTFERYLATLFLVNTHSVLGEDVYLHGTFNGANGAYGEPERMVPAPHFPLGWMCGKAKCEGPFEFVVRAGKDTIEVRPEDRFTVVAMTDSAFDITEQCRVIIVNKLHLGKTERAFRGELRTTKTLKETQAMAWAEVDDVDPDILNFKIRVAERKAEEARLNAEREEEEERLRKEEEEKARLVEFEAARARALEEEEEKKRAEESRRRREELIRAIAAETERREREEREEKERLEREEREEKERLEREEREEKERKEREEREERERLEREESERLAREERERVEKWEREDRERREREEREERERKEREEMEERERLARLERERLETETRERIAREEKEEEERKAREVNEKREREESERKEREEAELREKEEMEQKQREEMKEKERLGREAREKIARETMDAMEKESQEEERKARELREIRQKLEIERIQQIEREKKEKAQKEKEEKERLEREERERLGREARERRAKEEEKEREEKERREREEKERREREKQETDERNRSAKIAALAMKDENERLRREEDERRAMSEETKRNLARSTILTVAVAETSPPASAAVCANANQSETASDTSSQPDIPEYIGGEPELHDHHSEDSVEYFDTIEEEAEGTEGAPESGQKRHSESGQEPEPGTSSSSSGPVVIQQQPGTPTRTRRPMVMTAETAAWLAANPAVATGPSAPAVKPDVPVNTVVTGPATHATLTKTATVPGGSGPGSSSRPTAAHRTVASVSEELKTGGDYHQSMPSLRSHSEDHGVVQRSRSGNGSGANVKKDKERSKGPLSLLARTVSQKKRPGPTVLQHQNSQPHMGKNSKPTTPATSGVSMLADSSANPTTATSSHRVVGSTQHNYPQNPQALTRSDRSHASARGRVASSAPVVFGHVSGRVTETPLKYMPPVSIIREGGVVTEAGVARRLPVEFLTASTDPRINKRIVVV